MFPSWFRRKPARCPIVRHVRPRVEDLEERTVPAALLPDLQALPSYLSGWTVNTTTGGGRELRYSTAMANAGTGAFELRGTPNYETGIDGVQRQLVNQRVYQSDGAPQDRFAGYFVYHPGHGHIHFDDMAYGVIRIRTAGNGLGDVVALSPKTSFALIDINRFNSALPGSPSSAVYPTSDNQVQGISVGWNDVYGSGLAGQQINITGLANGDYWLELTVDPLNRIQETDETNNTSRLAITLSTLPTSGFRIFSSTPLGAQNTPASYVELNFSQAVNASTFTTGDVTFNGPNGTIPITSVTAVTTTQFRVNFATQATVGTYTMNIGPDIRTTSGALLDTNNNGTGGEAVDVYNNIFAITAPRIVGTTPTAAVNPPFNTVRVTFNKPMNSSSFTAADIFQFTGPNGVNLAAAITGIVPTSTAGQSTEFDINFTAQTALGAYTLVLEPTILDPNGIALDQNGDGVSNTADRYTVNFAVVPPGVVGPDSFGYDARSVPVQSLSLTDQTGVTSLSFTNTDDGTRTLPLGTNTFNFYGTTYTGANQLYVSTNGLLTFGAASDAYQNDDLSSLALPTIAVLWDDWIIGSGNPQVRYKFFDDNGDAVNDRLVIEWNRIYHYQTSPSSATFQAVLQLNTGATAGDILVNYPDLVTGDQFAGGASATVGLRSPGGTRLVAATNGSTTLVGNAKAIQFGVPRVLSVVREESEPIPSGDAEFFVTFSHAVTDVDPSDFGLSTTGNVTGAYIAHIHPTENPAVFEVHVKTGVGAGTVKLNVIDRDSIASVYGAKLGGLGFANGSFFAGETYTVFQPPPQIQGVNIGDGTSNRSTIRQIQVVFDYPVTFVGNPSAAFQLVKDKRTAVPVTVDLSLSTTVQTVARLTFIGSSSEFGSLADGNYALTILGNQIRTGGVFLDGDGNGAAGGNRVELFHRFFGDANGDGRVDNKDYVPMLAAMSPGPYNAAFDFRNDGQIDAADLTEFLKRLQMGRLPVALPRLRP